jgi:ATP-binding cassette subfamily F protein 2
LVYYGGNYTTYVRTKAENEVNQMKAYHKQQEEIAHIKKFIASAGTYANLVKQAKSKQKVCFDITVASPQIYICSSIVDH